jgi:hypothetical protein
MSPKPGLSRAIPMALIGFIIAAFLVTGIRALQQMDPLWDTGVVLVLAPFFVTGFFLWGMGGFDPKMSEHHAHEPEGGLVTALVTQEEAHDHHDEEPAKPLSILGAEIWRITTITLLLMLGLFAFATIPNRLVLQTVAEPEANVSAFDATTTFDLPVGLGNFEGSQLSVFIGFILFTVFSLFAFGGGMGLLMHFLSRNVSEAKVTTPSEKDLTPPAPARFIGRIAGNLARSLRKGLPSFFGIK